MKWLHEEDDSGMLPHPDYEARPQMWCGNDPNCGHGQCLTPDELFRFTRGLMTQVVERGVVHRHFRCCITCSDEVKRVMKGPPSVARSREDEP